MHGVGGGAQSGTRRVGVRRGGRAKAAAITEVVRKAEFIRGV